MKLGHCSECWLILCNCSPYDLVIDLSACWSLPDTCPWCCNYSESVIYSENVVLKFCLLLVLESILGFKDLLGLKSIGLFWTLEIWVLHLLPYSSCATMARHEELFRVLNCNNISCLGVLRFWCFNRGLWCYDMLCREFWQFDSGYGVRDYSVLLWYHSEDFITESMMGAGSSRMIDSCLEKYCTPPLLQS